MRPALDAVLFDLDGTLLDTAPDFFWTINTLLAEEGRPAMDFPALRAQVSHGARAMVQTAFDLTLDDPAFNQLHPRMLALYEQHLDVDTVLFDGLDALLEVLESASIPWGIVTNKPERYTTPLLNGLGLASRAGSVICPDQVNQRKPDPESLFLACRELKVRPAHCVYVGDHIRDIEAGRRAGMCTIAADYGYIDADDNVSNWQADHIIRHGGELLPLLHSLYSLDNLNSLDESV
ncbi:MAG: HAD-IA family hydrolase [Marinobacterium sp.]|nr:HAD-IA family hydrolase [Marinobacterium sp.]